MKSFKVKFLHAYRGHIYVLYIPTIGLSNFLSVDSRNFKKWGRSPTTAQNVGERLKFLEDDFMIKFKLMKNTFSVYLDIFNS